MERTRLVRASIAELRKNIERAEKRKKYFQNYLRNLHNSYAKKEISYSFYVETLHKYFDGRTIKQWIDYYGFYIQECQKEIKKHKKNIYKKNIITSIFSFILIFVLMSLIFLIQPKFIGFAIQEPSEISEIKTNVNATTITTQHSAILGETVKWSKKVSLDKPEIVTIRLPKDAERISVNKISYSNSYSEENLKEALQNQTSPFQKEPLSSSEIKEKSKAEFSITGKAILEEDEISEGFLMKILKNIGRITGQAIQQEVSFLKEIEIDDTATDYEIEYETPAPYSIEQETERGKEIKIISPETIHYENVLSFTNLSETLNIKNPSNVKIYWKENKTYISPLSIQDTNHNGIYDYVEWIAPSLSSQTFEIIIITKAEHLDSNKNFISDIYEQVKELDDIWSETIPANDYVRVTFEVPLDSSRDITLYPRIVSGNPKVEVYEINGNEKIAEFSNINSNQYNKIFLDGSSGTGLPDNYSQNTFDLKVLDGSVEIEHIIDPTETLSPIVHTNSQLGGVALDSTQVSAITSDDTSNIMVDKLTTLTAEMSELSGTINTLTDANCSLIYYTETGYPADSITFEVYDSFGGNLVDSSILPASDNVDSLVHLIDLETKGLAASEVSTMVVYVKNTIQRKPYDLYVDKISCMVDYIEVVDNPPKYYKPSVDDTTPNPSQSLSHNTYWTDDNTMSYATLEVNSSGINCDTTNNVTSAVLSASSEWANLSWSIPNACEGKKIGWRQYANDSANQWNMSMPLQTYTVQNIPPTVTLPVYTNATQYKNIQGLIFNISVIDIGVGASYCSINVAGNSNQTVAVSNGWCNGTYSLTGLSDGNQTINAYANDTLGNTALNNSYVVWMDTTPPYFTTLVNQSSYANTSLNYDIDAVDDGVGLDVFYIDDTTNFSIDSSTGVITNITILVEHYYVVNISVNDTAGNLNWDLWSLNVSAVPDTIPPIIKVHSPTNDSYSDSTIWFNMSADETIGKMKIDYNGTNVTRDVNSSLEVEDGHHHLFLWANDTSNNFGLNDTIWFTVDVTAPEISNVNANETKINQSEKFCLNATVTDSIAGVDTVYAEIWNTTHWLNYTMVDDGSTTCDGISGDNIYGIEIQGDTIGVWNYSKIWANDTFGNLNEYDFADLEINVTSPANSPPTINWVEEIGSQTPVDDSVRTISFLFNATDTNGESNLNDSTASAYFQLAGETTRSNTSCTPTVNSENVQQYNCTINMWYFDKADVWTINVTIKDNEGEYAENSSTTFVYQTHTGMKMSPTAINWDVAGLSDTDIGSIDDPITINNTGNDGSLNINVTAYNLQGEEITTQYISAHNFSVGDTPEGCTGTVLSNQTSIKITNATLGYGNHSLNDGTGQEQIYFCLKGLPQDISSQSYSSSAYGSWEIRILLVALATRRRRRKKKGKKKEKEIKDDRLIEALDLILEELKQEYSLNKKELIRILIEELKEKHKINKKDILEIIGIKEIKIPITIFSKKLGALESITKYMKENLNMTYKEISHEIKRNEKTIWNVYQKTKEKQKEPLRIKETKVLLPILIFENRKLTILESIIVYLKEKEMRFSEIAEILERDQRNVWTIYSRAIKKLNNKK